MYGNISLKSIFGKSSNLWTKSIVVYVIYEPIFFKVSTLGNPSIATYSMNYDPSVFPGNNGDKVINSQNMQPIAHTSIF